MDTKENIKELMKEQCEVATQICNNYEIAEQYVNNHDLDSLIKIANKTLELIDYEVIINLELMKYGCNTEELLQELKELRDVWASILH